MTIRASDSDASRMESMLTSGINTGVHIDAFVDAL
jgi:hypothetical protein